LYINSYNVVFL